MGISSTSIRTEVRNNGADLEPTLIRRHERSLEQGLTINKIGSTDNSIRPEHSRHRTMSQKGSGFIKNGTNSTFSGTILMRIIRHRSLMRNPFVLKEFGQRGVDILTPIISTNTTDTISTTSGEETMKELDVSNQLSGDLGLLCNGDYPFELGEVINNDKKVLLRTCLLYTSRCV